MKLSYKRTFLVGFAFLSISAFWQMYDTIIPVILKNTYQLPDGVAGIIMGLDNVVALFLLPLFGSLSDGNSSPKWVWYSLLGASILTGGLAFVSGNPAMSSWIMSLFPNLNLEIGSLANIELIFTILCAMCSASLLIIPLLTFLSRKVLQKLGRRIPFILLGTIGAVIMMALLQLAIKSFGILVFGIVLGFLLIFMGSYRSPAVALMPDVTPKPVRSKGNAIINLMGAFGGALVLIAMNFLIIKKSSSDVDYMYLLLAVGLIMIIAAITVVFTVPEQRYVQEMKDINYGVSKDEDQGQDILVDGEQKLPKDVQASLLLILATITLWFLGYNAVTTAFSKYAIVMWGNAQMDIAQSYKLVSRCLLVATGAAVLSYLPIGFLASRIGRKKTIVIGLVVALACFIFGSVGARTFSPMLYVMFAAIGFAQAAVTVNTFPMVWEISRFGNVGKYTGFYYTCSMAAQVVTPIVSGYLLQYVGYDTLFPYAAVFIALAIVPVSLAKHGDSKPGKPQSKLETLAGADD